MKSKRFLIMLAALIVLGSLTTVSAKSKAAPLPEALEARETSGKRTCDQLAPGVAYYHRYYKDPFGDGDGPLSIHYLVIDWNKTEKGFSLAYANCGGKRRRPSEMATERRALAGVNGGYHATKDPTTPFYVMKLDGVVLPSMQKGGDTSLAFNHGEMPVIRKYSQEVLDSYENVLSGDGITGFHGQKRGASKAARQKDRAPCTFIGQNSTNRLTVIAVADGRSKRSIGLSFTEECAMIMPFGCEQVVNIDGGGSSVMVVRDGDNVKKLDIVNIPSDGRERRVCDALLLLDGRSLSAEETKGKNK